MKAPHRLSVLARVTRSVVTHEATHRHPLGPPLRFLLWQGLKRVRRGPVTIHAFGEAQLRCYPDRNASNSVLYFGWPDWAEMHLLARLLRPGDGFLDVGANVGSYTVLAWSRVRPSGRVIAIEPDPGTAAILRENVRLNAMRDDTVVEAAVGETSGDVHFATGRDTVGRVATEADTGRVVSMVSLNELVSTPGDFIAGKMDLEGYELSALRGAERLLGAGSPACWILEMNGASEAYGTSRTTIEKHLATFGYELYEVLGDGDRLSRVPRGGPYPENVLAVADTARLRERIPDLQIVG